MVALQEAMEVWLEDADESPSVPSPERLKANGLPIWSTFRSAWDSFRAVYLPTSGHHE